MRRLIWQIPAIALVLQICLFTTSPAGSIVNQQTPSIRQEITRLEYQPYRQTVSQEQGIGEDIYQYKEKSTKRAFIYSLLLPGAGEYYAESKTKTAVFLGMEAAFWFGYFYYHNKAQDKENEFKDYADQNWSEDEYLTWLSTYCTGATSDRDPCVRGSDTTYWTEHLPDTKNQQYYEMVGKYDQFNAGWTDASNMDDISRFRESYMDMRYDSNKLFDKAKYATMAALANHLLSAFDAAWTAKKYNQKADRFAQIDFKVRVIDYEDELVPKALVTFRF